MNILVLGGNGFIGSHLVDELLADGHSVRVFDRFPEKFRRPQLGVDYREGHFGDAFSIGEALQGVDIVYHLVCTTVPGTSNLNPAADISDNLIASVALLDVMVKMGVKRIVYLSSGGTVYGNPQNVPVRETHPLNPICSYGVVKVAVENYLTMYEKLYGLQPTIIRPSNPYGPRQGHIGGQGVIATFLKSIMNHETLKVWGDGSVVRDYIYVGDLARLCSLVGTKDVRGTYNAGYGEGFSLNQIIAMISSVVGVSPLVEYQPARSYDVKEVVLDNSIIRERLSWKPETTIQTGIMKHWKWIKETTASSETA